MMHTILDLLSPLLSLAVLVVVAVREIAWSKRYKAARDAEAEALKARVETLRELTSPAVKEHLDATKTLLEERIEDLKNLGRNATQSAARLRRTVLLLCYCVETLHDSAKRKADELRRVSSTKTDVGVVLGSLLPLLVSLDLEDTTGDAPAQLLPVLVDSGDISPEEISKSDIRSTVRPARPKSIPRP
jgi:hypothetical protein